MTRIPNVPIKLIKYFGFHNNMVRRDFKKHVRKTCFPFSLFSSSLPINNNSNRKKGYTDASSKNCGYRKVLSRSRKRFLWVSKTRFWGDLASRSLNIFVSRSRILKSWSRTVVRCTRRLATRRPRERRRREGRSRSERKRET